MGRKIFNFIGVITLGVCSQPSFAGNTPPFHPSVPGAMANDYHILLNGPCKIPFGVNVFGQTLLRDCVNSDIADALPSNVTPAWTGTYDVPISDPAHPGDPNFNVYELTWLAPNVAGAKIFSGDTLNVPGLDTATNTYLGNSIRFSYWTFTDYGASPVTSTTVGEAPEPATWLSFLTGFGLLGAALRRRAMVRVRYAIG